MFTPAQKRERRAFERLAEAAKTHTATPKHELHLQRVAARMLRRAALMYATAALDVVAERGSK
jgi:hypothetical protein